MAKLITWTCDQCKTTTQTRGDRELPPRWLEVKRWLNSDKYFCEWKCLALFASHNAAVQANPTNLAEAFRDLGKNLAQAFGVNTDDHGTPETKGTGRVSQTPSSGTRKSKHTRN